MRTKFPLKEILIILLLQLSYSVFTSAQTLLDPSQQPQFINALPVPPVLDARNGGTFTMEVRQHQQWLGLINPATGTPMKTTVWGYNGSYPGPTVLATKGKPVNVWWKNMLVDASNKPLPHLLPLDTTVHWAYDGHPEWLTQYGVPLVPHLHGGHVESASDGLPESWYAPNFTKKGRTFVKGDSEPYYYINDQEAATIWYHDHAMGITRLNVYAGLAGYYLITDDNEKRLQATGKLPAAPYDMGLAIQDKMFNGDGSLHYPSEESGIPHPSILPEFFGDFILVNGMVWPVLDVEPRQYRFRMLNGSDSRFYDMFFSEPLSFTQIGSDLGFLPSPVSHQKMLIAPGERKDIIVDFSNPALIGKTIILHNDANSPYPDGDPVDAETNGKIMAFRVTKPLNTNYPLTHISSDLRTSPIVPLQSNLPVRKLILFEGSDDKGRLEPMVGTVSQGAMEYGEPITENPQLHDTEIWELYNLTMDAHPVHLHLVKMQLINRQEFTGDSDPETGKLTNIQLVGQPLPPPPGEQGWKDTWVMLPGEVTRVIANFDMTGLYVWHCHILSHEDHEMMRPYYVGEIPLWVKELDMKAYPNPFVQSITIEINMPKDGDLKFRLFDAKGSLVRTIEKGTLLEGFNRFSIPVNNLAGTIYFLEASSPFGTKTIKLIKSPK